MTEVEGRGAGAIRPGSRGKYMPNHAHPVGHGRYFVVILNKLDIHLRMT